MKKFIIILILGVLTLAGCKTKYVSVPEYHTQYLTKVDSFVKCDSAYIHDSVFFSLKGDTVFISKVSYRDKYHYLYRTKLDTIIKRDSIPYPVERELTKNEQRLMSLGRSFVILLVLLTVVLVIYWYRNKKC